MKPEGKLREMAEGGFGKTIDDKLIFRIFEEDMKNLGFHTSFLSKIFGRYHKLSSAEEMKAIARRGYKPGQIVHRNFIEKWHATRFEELDEVPYRALRSRKDADPSAELAPGLVLHLPIISANMESVTGYDLAVAMARIGGLGGLHQYMNIDEAIGIVKKIKSLRVEPYSIEDMVYTPTLDSQGRYEVCVFRGIKDYKIEHAKALWEAGVRVMGLDVAHAHSDGLTHAIYETKRELPEMIIIAGNVATPKATYELCEAGADIPKVGIAGSIACATGPNTGARSRHPEDIYACGLTAKKAFGRKIIGDGGFNSGGKIVAGLAFLAEAVMAGQLPAATDEANLLEERIVRDEEGNPVLDDSGKEQVYYYGSASEFSKKKQGRPDYDASEGNVVKLPRAGSAYLMLAHLDMLIRSGISYAGRSTNNGGHADIKRLQEHSRWLM